MGGSGWRVRIIVVMWAIAGRMNGANEAGDGTYWKGDVFVFCAAKLKSKVSKVQTEYPIAQKTYC